MRLVLLLSSALAAACSPEPRRPFPVGILGPVGTRVASEASRLGLEVADQPPLGAVVESAADVSTRGSAAERTADLTSLRFLAARAAARGAAGVFFRLPVTPSGRDILDYEEEWQAVNRVAREMLSVQLIVERGAPSPVPFAVPSGVDARAWTFSGRRYVLLVNASGADAPLDAVRFSSWRALFAVRADAGQVLIPCETRRCLPPEGVLWLEGRLLD